MRGIFLDEMKKLNLRYITMGINVNEQIYLATKSYIEHDKQLAKEVIAGDEKINDEEVQLEKDSLQLMALKQPMASDFRMIISALKSSSDLERIGDHAASIAVETIRVKGNERVPKIEKLIAEMTDLVRNMMEKVLDAYAKDDIEIAKSAAKIDLEIDIKFVEARKEIIAEMAKETEAAVANASYLTVIRLLERIGDHIVNLAEWVVYRNTNKLVELNPGKLDRDVAEKVVDGEKLDQDEMKLVKEAEACAQPDENL